MGSSVFVTGRGKSSLSNVTYFAFQADGKNYEFAYQVDDEPSKNKFGHVESKLGDSVVTFRSLSPPPLESMEFLLQNSRVHFMVIRISVQLKLNEGVSFKQKQKSTFHKAFLYENLLI